MTTATPTRDLSFSLLINAYNDWQYYVAQAQAQSFTATRGELGKITAGAALCKTSYRIASAYIARCLPGLSWIVRELEGARLHPEDFGPRPPVPFFRQPGRYFTSAAVLSVAAAVAALVFFDSYLLRIFITYAGIRAAFWLHEKAARRNRDPLASVRNLGWALASYGVPAYVLNQDFIDAAAAEYKDMAKRAEAAEREAKRAAEARNPRRIRNPEVYGVAIARYESSGSSADDDTPAWTPDLPAFNTNGLPMVGGYGGLDITGHVYSDNSGTNFAFSD